MREPESKSRRKDTRRRRVTGLHLDRELVIRAKHRALDESTSLTKLVNKAIEIYLQTARS